MRRRKERQPVDAHSGFKDNTEADCPFVCVCGFIVAGNPGLEFHLEALTTRI